MIVVISYQLHDYERRMFVVDTAKLDTSHRFEKDVKAAAEGDRDYVTLNGPDYEDDWGDFGGERPERVGAVPPCHIDKAMHLDVNFG